MSMKVLQALVVILLAAHIHSTCDHSRRASAHIAVTDDHN